MSTCRVIGILLAAGKSSRMGQLKQLIPVVGMDGRTKPLVAAAFDTISPACDQMVVAVGFGRDRVMRALGSRRFAMAESSADAQMVDSARSAFRCANVTEPVAKRDDHSNAPSDGTSDLAATTFAQQEVTFLLQLGDHPHVRRQTLDQLVREARAYPDHVIIPRHNGHGGHPILIPGRVVDMLLAGPLPDGLRGFWRANPELCRYLEVDDVGVTIDLDTPEALRQLRANEHYVRPK